MSNLPIHPKLVHLPMALAVLMPLITSGVLIAILRGWMRQRAWAIVVAFQTLLFVGGLIAQRTGEADGDRVERIVPETALEAHEEAAEAFVWATGVLLGVALLPLVIRRRTLGHLAGGVTLAGTVIVLGLAIRVGEAGGALVYRHGAATAFAGATEGADRQPAAIPRPREDDDDR